MKTKGFLQEAGGGFSATRLAFLLWVVGVLLVWGYDSVTGGTLKPIDNSIIILIGILMTGKVAQKFGETSSDDSTTPQTPPTTTQPATPPVVPKT